MTEQIQTFSDLTEFFKEIDLLKQVHRRSYIIGGERLENSAEHSWQLAMASWCLAEYFQLNIDHERLIKLALVHDLGEIDNGDTFLYAQARPTAFEDERLGVARLNEHHGNAIKKLLLLWDEQELGTSAEAQLMKVTDRILPFLLNLNNAGKPWVEHAVKRSQVENAHAFIEDLYPEIHQWITLQIAQAVEKGWLIDE